MSRELDEACALALGKKWTRPTHGSCCTCQTCGWDYDNCQCGYSEDPEKAMLLEDYIAGQEQIVRGRYVWKLCAFIGTRQVDLSALEMFMLIRATPEQRARAFLEAIK